jgi:DNA-binding MarR family transcriptional regulator
MKQNALVATDLSGPDAYTRVHQASEPDEYRSLRQWFASMRSYACASGVVLKKFRLTPLQYTAMLEIYTSSVNDGFTVGALAANLKTTHSATVELVNKLCKKGYVDRSRCLQDRRKVHLHLTAGGRAALDELISIDRQEFLSVLLQLDAVAEMGRR